MVNGMNEGHRSFDTRLRQFRKTHLVIPSDTYARIYSGGSITQAPARLMGVSTRKSGLRHLIGFVMAVVAFKAFLLYSLGEPLYQARVDYLARGGLIEQFVAWGADVGAVTRMLADLLQHLLG